MVRVLVLLICTAAMSYGDTPAAEFAARRTRLLEQLPQSVIVLRGLPHPAAVGDRNGFFQEPNFYYLSGWNQPGAAMLLCSSCPEDLRQTFFLPVRNERREKYEGKQLAPEDADAPARTGFARIRSMNALEKEIGEALAHAANYYTLFDGTEEHWAKLAPLRPVKDVRATITKQRAIKSAAEIALLEKAIAATIDAHFASWRTAKPGLFEYEIAAVMQQTYYRQGCERNAYAPIVGSGPNSVVLHYHENKRRMDSGDLLLMDVGGECSHYAADITRTIPVNGKFTPRQREIYQLVLGAQEAIIARAKPGILLADLTRFGHEYLDGQGKGPGGKPWRDFTIHGVSHHIGLDVHDPHDAATPLAEGMVVTVEPGLYLAEENLGVRIEDMILITKDGARVLSKALPKTVEEIEKGMRR
ncbi:MAG: Xaa-Pro aminopeptidase [Bryobacter sp.]|nr:Xaa-Pro aminopeptidase [Bryobacter sp.]